MSENEFAAVDAAIDAMSAEGGEAEAPEASTEEKGGGETAPEEAKEPEAQEEEEAPEEEPQYSKEELDAWAEAHGYQRKPDEGFTFEPERFQMPKAEYDAVWQNNYQGEFQSLWSERTKYLKMDGMDEEQIQELREQISKDAYEKATAKTGEHVMNYQRTQFAERLEKHPLKNEIKTLMGVVHQATKGKAMLDPLAAEALAAAIRHLGNEAGLKEAKAQEKAAKRAGNMAPFIPGKPVSRAAPMTQEKRWVASTFGLKPDEI